MSETTAPPVVLTRLVIDYQMFGDMEAKPWVDLVMGHAKADGTIVDYEFVHSLTGAWGLQHITFTADLYMQAVRPEQVREQGTALFNAIIGDSDVSVRFSTPIQPV